MKCIPMGDPGLKTICYTAIIWSSGIKIYPYLLLIVKKRGGGGGEGGGGGGGGAAGETYYLLMTFNSLVQFYQILHIPL